MPQYQLCFFAIAAGLVSSGLVGNLWGLITGEALSVEGVAQGGLLSPLRGLVYVLSLPSRLLFYSLCTVVSRPLNSALAVWIGTGLAFVQGVVVMTRVFGVN